jgi:hypothetical protein
VLYILFFDVTILAQGSHSVGLSLCVAGKTRERQTRDLRNHAATVDPHHLQSRDVTTFFTVDSAWLLLVFNAVVRLSQWKGSLVGGRNKAHCLESYQKM